MNIEPGFFVLLSSFWRSDFESRHICRQLAHSQHQKASQAYKLEFIARFLLALLSVLCVHLYSSVEPSSQS